MEEDLVGEVRGNKSSAQDIEEEMLPIAEEFLQKIYRIIVVKMA